MSDLTLEEVKVLLLNNQLTEDQLNCVLSTLNNFLENDLELLEKDYLVQIVKIALRGDSEASSAALSFLANYFAFPDKAGAATKINCSDVRGLQKTIFSSLSFQLIKPNCYFTKSICLALSNLTSHEAASAVIAKEAVLDNFFNQIVVRMCTLRLPEMMFFLNVVQNLTQQVDFRRFLLNSKEIMDTMKLLEFSDLEEENQGSLAGILKNCCFDPDLHSMILEEYCLLNKFTDPLKNFKNFKSDVLLKVLEGLYQLRASKYGREYMRKEDVYEVLKDFFNSTSSESLKEECENVIGILIREEEEMNVDNMKELKMDDQQVP